MKYRIHLLVFFEEVYRPQRLNGSVNTDKVYRAAISHLSRFLDRPSKLGDLTEETLPALLCDIANHCSPVSCNTYVAKLMALARFAFRKGYLKAEPDIKYLKEPKRVPQAWRTDEIGRLLAVVQGLGGNVDGLPANLWWTAFVQTIYWTGLRVGAARQIERQNVDLQRGYVFAEAETQKQNADQLLRIHADCIVAIRAIWEPKRKLMFPWPFCKQTLYNHFRRILGAAELPNGRRDLFQKIRRTTYSYSKLGGIDAGRQLGHSRDLSAHYEDPTITQQRQACDVLPRPEPPKPTLRIVG